MKTKLTLLIVILIIVPLTFIGCKTELKERITELEGKLAEEGNEVVQEDIAEVEEEEAPPAMITDTMPVEETATGEDESGDEESDTTTDSDVEKVAPTISLEIYEGPTLDGSICYYRVKASITGSPNPTVTFSKDDSGGAWGSKKVQVNLNDPTETYTLTATATNSEGSATDSIDLSWGCTIPDPDPEPDPDPDLIEKDVDIGADTNLSGHIISDTRFFTGPSDILAGDWNNNKSVKAYLSFDISSINAMNDVSIKDVSVTIPVNDIHGDPDLAGDEMHVMVYDYGDSLTLADQGDGGEIIFTFGVYYNNYPSNFSFSNNKLKDELQKAIDMDKKWLQLKINLNGVAVNHVSDYFSIPVGNVVLHFEYEIPG